LNLAYCSKIKRKLLLDRSACGEDMLEKPPELSPDLEWMLQCGQASDSALVEALVREHYAEVYRLAAGIAGDPARAEAVAARALADAVLNAHRYPVGLGVQTWLFSLVRERAGAPREPEAEPLPDVPLPVFSDETIEQLKAGIHRILARERRKRWFFAVQEILIVGLAILGIILADRWTSSLNPEPTPLPTQFHTALVTQLVFISATPPPNPTPTQFPERAILYVAEAGDTLASIAEKTGLEAALLHALNGLEADAPLQSGQAVMLGLGGIPLAHITPTPVTPAPPSVPLTTASAPAEVLQRIFESERYFHTLWVEAQVIDYGPPGIAGPPQVKRLQAWISRPSFSLALLGDPSGRLERVSLTNSGKTYTSDILTGERILYNSYSLELMQLDELVQQSYSNIDTSLEQEIVGIEPVAGREALVVDGYLSGAGLEDAGDSVRMQRFWVDTRAGVILRLQRFERQADAAEFLVTETIVEEIAFDVDLPNTLFDPYRPLPSAFARDYTGEPFPEGLSLPTPTWVPLPGRELLPRITPPPDFDPSRSRLTFQWTHGSAFDNDQFTLTDFFAGRYYLGSIDFGDPDRLICARSLDGRRIAYSEWLERPPYGTAPLRWLDLADMTRIVQPLEGVQAQVLAFSPDSQKIAFVGSEGANETGLYVVNMASDYSQRILDLDSGDNLSWSPDGQYLILTGSENPGSNWKLLVVDAVTGEIAYRGSIEWGQEGQFILPEDSPAITRGLLIFSPVVSAVEACARPPE
jgi:hypothetical protein